MIKASRVAFLAGISTLAISAPVQAQQNEQAVQNAPQPQAQGNNCDKCNNAEVECTNNCVMKGVMSGKDPALDMEQASKNAACLAMCEQAKSQCTCN